MSLTRPPERRTLVVGGNARSSLKNAILQTLRQPRAVMEHVRAKTAEVKAELQGQAVSRARMLKQLKDVNPGLLRPRRSVGAPQRTDVMIRDMRGRPMVFFTDGSLRHALGYKPTQAERKQAKAKRKEQARRAS